MVAAFSFGMTPSVMAQDEVAEEATEQVDSVAEEATDSVAAEEAAPAVEETVAPVEEEEGLHKTLKTKFIEGNAGFMSLVAIALVLGLAFCIERVIYLTLAQVNTRKFLAALAEKVKANKVDEAIEYCAGTRGPVAQISKKAMQCLASDDQNDIATIERSINIEAEVQGAYLEENCSWITLFIAMAPSLGFLGTVIGMVQAFWQMSEAGGNLDISMLSGGIYQAMITTVGGLIVGIVALFGYNYLVAKVDGVVNELERKSLSFMDIMNEDN